MNMSLVVGAGLLIAGLVLGFAVVYGIRWFIAAKARSHKKAGQSEQAPCVWCGRAEYSELNPSFPCPECGTIYHDSCWKKYGGCSDLECRLAPTQNKTEKIA